MKTSKQLSYVLSLVSLFALMLISPTLAVNQRGAEQAQFEQQMRLSLGLWLSQQSEFQAAVDAKPSTPAAEVENGGTASIEGKVTSSDGSPLTAYVFAWSLNGGAMNSGSAVTDAEGNYKIVNLPAGEYRVAAAANGYMPQLWDHTTSLRQAKPVPVGEGEEVSGIDFSLTALPTTPGTGSIAGSVKNEADNQPIADAWVIGVWTSDSLSFVRYFAATDAEGGFKLVGLLPGDYILFVQAKGFVAEFYDNVFNPLEAKAVHVGLGQEVTGIEVLLAKGGSISGVVTDSTNAGIAGVSVAATAESMNGWVHWLLSPVWPYATTDENGAYKITGLAAGKYFVSAALRSTEGILVQWWENADRYEDADPVEVKSAEDTPNINFNFAATKATGAIAGTVVDVEQTPLSGIWVTAWNKNTNEWHHYWNFPNGAKTDTNGQYQINELQAGEYLVSATRLDWWNFQSIWYDGVTSPDQATPVLVQNDQVTTGIDFTFDKAKELGAISGKVVFDESGAPVAGALVQAVRMRSTPMPAHSHVRPFAVARTNANGEYVLDDLLAGDYLVSVRFNGYGEFYDDAQNVGDADAVTVVDGKTTSEINFSIPAAPAGSSLSGHVSDDSTGEPIANAVVGVFPSFNSTWPIPGWSYHRLFFTAMTDAEGNYSVVGIPAGSYIVSAWARGYIGEFYDDHTNPLDADVIQLDGTEAKTGIDFALTPGRRFVFDQPLASGNQGSISGHVTSGDGRSIEGAFVYALDVNKAVQASEATGADGQYTLGGLAEGDYYVMVGRVPYTPEYYDNAANVTDAKTVTVGGTANAEVANVDFQLVAEVSTSVGPGGDAAPPTEYALEQNYPNPFNPTTSIRYTLPKAGHVRLQIFNLRGELIRTLVDSYQAAESYQMSWDGENDQGQLMPSGIYLYRLQSGDFSQTLRLLFLK